MTTIFLNNLKDLVAGQLKQRWCSLNNQQKKFNFGMFKLSSFFYDTNLSEEQASIIGTLEANILLFTGTDDDFVDKNAIKELISVAYQEVEKARAKHRHSDESRTLKCLEDLKNAIDNFYDKVAIFPFSLLNVLSLRTPEHIVYSHACRYLGLSKFQEDTHGSIDVRQAKEEALCKRLESLSKAIRPEEYTLDQQRDVALTALRDLARDNQDAIEPEKGATVPVVSVGATLVGVHLKPQLASLGSLDKEINAAVKQIEELTVDNSDCPREEDFEEEVVVDGHNNRSCA